MYNLDIKTEGRRKVVITVTSEIENIGVQNMIRVLAQYLKHLIDENGLSFDEVSIKPGDKAEIKKR